MAILVDSNTRILVQGITGDFGSRHAKLSLDYGTQLVAGVTPGKGGQTFEHGVHKVPVFDTVAQAVAATGANASVIFVPPPLAADAICEAVDAGIPTLCTFFSRDLAGRLRSEGRAADVIIANNVLAHVPDLNGVVEGMRLLLKPTGMISVGESR